MMQSLQTLASDATPESRAQLCDRVLNIYFNNEQEPSETEKALFGDVTLRLMQDMASDICARIAERVAPSDRTPHGLAMSLAKSDDEQVYAPILQNSPVLTDDDLVEIVNDSSEGHRLSIASRPEVTTKVTDALVQTGEMSVLRRVTENTGAQFSNEGLSVIVEKSGEDELLLKVLTERGQTKVGTKPTEFFEQLKEVITSGLGDLADREYIEQEFSPEQINGHLDRLLKLKMMDRNRVIRMKNLVKDIKKSGKSYDLVISDFTKEEHIRDLVILIANLLEIRDTAVQGAYLNNDPSAFSMLCHALKVSAETYKELVTTRLLRLGKDSTQVPQLVKAYERISNKESQRLVRIIKMNS